jgi:hypothetical protein
MKTITAKQQTQVHEPKTQTPPRTPFRAQPKKEGEANMISAAFPYQKQRRRVLSSEMAYVEVGEGDPIVLLRVTAGFRPHEREDSPPA